MIKEDKEIIEKATIVFQSFADKQNLGVKVTDVFYDPRLCLFFCQIPGLGFWKMDSTEIWAYEDKLPTLLGNE